MVVLAKFLDISELALWSSTCRLYYLWSSLCLILDTSLLIMCQNAFMAAQPMPWWAWKNPDHQGSFFFFFGLCFLFLFYFLLYNIVLVLPYINMNPPQVPKILLTHSHLMPHESSTLALLGPSNTLRAVLECVFNWYKRWHGLVPEPHGSALWLSSRALPNTSHNVFS